MTRIFLHGNMVWRTFKSQYLIRGHGSANLRLLQYGKCSQNHFCKSTREIHSRNLAIRGQQWNQIKQKRQPHERFFSTSNRHYVPPLAPMFWVFAKPLAKVASVISGRTLRKLFQRLPEAQRQKWYDRIKAAMPAVMIGIVGFSAVSYYTHIEETPITKRKRYIAFTEEQFLKIAQFEYETQIETLKDKIVPVTDPYYRKVHRVVKNLVNSNQDIDFLKKHTLTIIVVEQKERNAFVLPTGHIFVYTGLLNMVQNEDQLAVVMGHELAHAILLHGAERVSAAGFVDNFIIMVLGAIWFFIPSDGIALVTHWFFDKVVQLLLSLPYDRKLETEADDVGLQLMAKACYDVRESSNFWDLMKFLSETESENDDASLPELFSTHPSNETRINTLTKMIPQAIGMRDECKCPRLSDRDPRIILQHMKSIIENGEGASVKIGKDV